MKRTGLILGVSALAVVAGCASPPPGPTVAVMPGQGKSFDVFQQDQYACTSYANQQVGGQAEQANNQAVGSAVLGTVLGAGIGAADGPPRRAAGAGPRSAPPPARRSGPAWVRASRPIPAMAFSSVMTSPTPSAWRRTATRSRPSRRPMLLRRGRMRRTLIPTRMAITPAITARPMAWWSGLAEAGVGAGITIIGDADWGRRQDVTAAFDAAGLRDGAGLAPNGQSVTPPQ